MIIQNVTCVGNLIMSQYWVGSHVMSSNFGLNDCKFVFDVEAFRELLPLWLQLLWINMDQSLNFPKVTLLTFPKLSISQIFLFSQNLPILNRFFNVSLSDKTCQFCEYFGLFLVTRQRISLHLVVFRDNLRKTQRKQILYETLQKKR